MARVKGGDVATTLAPETARRLGIGNSTGLGLAPFIVNHPLLFNNWIAAREDAIARVCALSGASTEDVSLFRTLLARSGQSIADWSSDHPVLRQKIADLKRDLAVLNAYLDSGFPSATYPWAILLAWCSHPFIGRDRVGRFSDFGTLRHAGGRLRPNV